MPAETLNGDTLLTDGPATPPRQHRSRSEAAGWNPRWCDACNLGNHPGCTGVSCYGCPPENHPRHPGVSGLGDGVEHGAPKPGGARP